MLFNLRFVSLNNRWILAMKTLFNDDINVSVELADISCISNDGIAFVSPGNCIGYMDGGIDVVLNTKLFPNIQRDVQKKIKEVGKTTALGRKYIEVGSAVLVPKGTSALICAPTMFQPEDVSNTNNAYDSFMAALLMITKYNRITGTQIKTLVVTSHCCGYGRMLETTSALQIHNAYIDFIRGKFSKEIDRFDDPCCLLMPDT